MAKYFVRSLLVVCLLCAFQEGGSVQENLQTSKVKRDAAFELSGTKLNQEAKEHSREKRAADEKKSYIFLRNKSGRTAKLYWRDIKKSAPAAYYRQLVPEQTIRIDTYDRHEWSATEVNGNSLLLNDKQKIIQKANTPASRAIYVVKRPGQHIPEIGDKYVEMMVVLDKAAVDMHKTTEQVRRYVMTFLKLATTILQHKDLTQHGVRIHLVLSKLVLLDRELAAVKMDPAANEKNLGKVCTYMNKIGNNGPVKFDHKLFLTKNVFGVGGYANTYGMCSQYSSCSMVFDYGFLAAFLVAHEVAHSLGMNDREFGQHSGYVMSSLVDARFNFHKWSTYSQISLLRNIGRKTCLNNKPHRLQGLPTLHKYPGVHFSLEMQCHFEYGTTYSAWIGRKDPCEKLRCQMPPPDSDYAKTSESPPLDGSECGINKWCISGTCTARSADEVVANPLGPKRIRKVDGGWGDWRAWSRCSRTCSTGVQHRYRGCVNPVPRNGGRPCVGFSKQVKVCDTGRACSTSVSPKEAKCKTTGRKVDPKREWKFYDDSPVDISCAFENGLCRWTNDETMGNREWILKKGATPSSYTGPSADHTFKTSTGQYIYFESSIMSKAKAVLSSPEMKVRQGCLDFWFHMWGDGLMGQLKVIKVGSRKTANLLWKRSGSQGNLWRRQMIEIRDSQPYKILFVAKKKEKGYKSDIALDDVKFWSGSCSSRRITQRNAPVNPCVIKCKTSDNKSPTKIISGVNMHDGTRCFVATISGVCYRGKCKPVGCDNILSDGGASGCVVSKGKQSQTVIKTRPSTASRLNCDFERNYCHWRNMLKSNTVNWLRVRQTGKGYHLQVRRSTRQRGLQMASITSPEVTIPTACLMFSYQVIRQRGYAVLRVKYLGKNRKTPAMKKLLAATKSGWKEVKVDFHQGQSYQVVFEAIVSSSNLGYVAIDNIRFQPGRCSASKG